MPYHQALVLGIGVVTFVYVLSFVKRYNQHACRQKYYFSLNEYHSCNPIRYFCVLDLATPLFLKRNYIFRKKLMGGGELPALLF